MWFCIERRLEKGGIFDIGVQKEFFSLDVFSSSEQRCWPSQLLLKTNNGS